METLDQTGGGVSQAAIASMKGASPWMKVIAIINFIFLAIVAIASIISLFGSAVTGLIMCAFTGLAIYTNVLLMGMGSSLSNFAASPNGAALDKFFANTKKYFMIWGILLIVYVVLVIVMMISGNMLMQMMAGMMQGGM